MQSIKNILKKFNIIIISLGVFLFYVIFINFMLNFFINFSIKEKNIEYNFLTSLEKKTLDLLMRMKAEFKKTSYFFNYTQRNLSKNVSNDIIIIGIDEKSLNMIGKWPFKRNIHSKIVDYFTNSKYRENTLFFDVFFVEPDIASPEDDFLFIESLKKNQKIVFDCIGKNKSDNMDEENDFKQRIEFQIKKFGELKNIFGVSNKALTFDSFTIPLIPYLDSINDIGVANTVEDNDKIVRKFPLIIKYVDKKYLNFLDLKEGDYADNLLLINYKIQKYSNNTYKLVENETKIFDQDKIDFIKRKTFTRNDIDTIKSRMDKISNDFILELEKFRSNYEKENQKIILQINNHLKNSILPEDLKKQIYSIFNQKENLKDIDEFLEDLSNELDNYSKIEEKYKKESYFFKNLYKNCIKLERVSEKTVNNKIEKLSLYDFIYYKTDIYFDTLKNVNQKFLQSAPLVLISRYFHTDKNNIEIIFGKEVRLYNPQVYNSDKDVLEKPKFLGNKDYLSIPIDDAGFIEINFLGGASTTQRNAPTTFDAYSYADFISGKNILIKNKICLVGAFSNGMADDLYQTPFKTMFGIEVIANTINTAIMNNYIKYLPNFFYFFILLLVSFILTLICSYKDIIKSYFFAISFVVLYFILVCVLFINFNIVLETVKVLIIAIFSVTSTVVYRIFTEERQKKQIKNIFSKYVHPSVVEELLKNPPELGGVDMDITVLFSDIRGFTGLGEMLTSQELVNFLNKYLTSMTDIIINNNGTLDKYMGDGIMCFWGAPKTIKNHAELTCRAALQQMAKLEELNKELSEIKRINIGIGINSGVMTAANMGSPGRMNYTIMGDNVNLGSRLESTNKYYGTNIIVSEYTYQQVKDKFVFRELDFIRVKGKNKPIKIYELICEKFELEFLENKI
ncbi:MAG: hypothetical protein A2Y34_07965 [Spirochaetes bacterium GWC1_27_15]|nr:MAG: hypothetical protein A2Z98_10240 [Spirochaetes bacterium GWB1_27_13]OHD26560.1 MAG: hypothetical protein A2Y34_07965 [Spirochaetes bacterium GWC1_27_15]